MNTYDFDKTIYLRDSSVDFTLWCLKKYPSAVLRIIPTLAVKGLRYAFKRCDFRELKEATFSYLRHIPNVSEEVRLFWNKKRGGIGQWYLARRRDDDIIISASPEFLLRPIADLLNVELIATEMDSATGKLLGKNCHDKEKVRRLFEKHPNAQIDEFYSDSLTHTPMAEAADKAFRVSKGKIKPWERA